jgi:HAD superfamily hydrolase (TIGR01509 family)
MPDRDVRPIDAVILDIDGTLIDSNPLHVLAWLRAFRRLGHEVEAERILDLMGMGGDKLAPAILGKDARADCDQARAYWAEEYSGKGLIAHAEPLPGAIALLRSLKDRGVRVALASSGERSDIERYLSRLGGNDAFDELVTSADVRATKPSPDIFAVAVERLGSPQHAWVVGDTPYDVEAARALGLPCLAVLTGGFSRARLEAAGAAAVCVGAREVEQRLIQGVGS